ncbi:MAG: hypothetical protein H8K05_21585 [Nitrospira sp.]|nr:hypothetical protein [Nitrospira sp.]
MTYLLFLLRSVAGLFLSLVIFGTIFFPAVFSGEVFHPLLVPYIGGMCIGAMAFPLAYLQSRVTLSGKVRRIVPIVYGLLWLPLTVAVSYVLSPHSNVWVSGLRAGLLAASISFLITLACFKLGDLVAKHRKMRQVG